MCQLEVLTSACPLATTRPFANASSLEAAHDPAQITRDKVILVSGGILTGSMGFGDGVTLTLISEDFGVVVLRLATVELQPTSAEMLSVSSDRRE
jgi:hypothetical protein